MSPVVSCVVDDIACKLTDCFVVLLDSNLLDLFLEISSQRRCLVDMFTIMSSFAQICL